MHTINTVTGKNYSITYPCFHGENTNTVNAFYEDFAKIAEAYFQNLTSDDNRAVCRALVSVTEEDDSFSVSIRLLLRRNGKKCGDKTLIHKWKGFEGKDFVLIKP